MIKVDKLAVVHQDAEIGDNCGIGPFCTVGPHTRIGANTILRSHVLVEPHTIIGEDCDIFPFVSLGIQSQDLKYIKGTVTYTEIGDRNIIREFVSIHSGTLEGSKTSIGNDCALQTQAHVAHNCTVGDHVIISHGGTIAGHVTLGDRANIGGLAGVIQFANIGQVAMVAAMARVIQDVLPFTIADGFPAQMRVINRIGMERAGYKSKDIDEVRKAFRILFLRGLKLEEAISQVRTEFPASTNVQLMLDAIQPSQRGLARPKSDTNDDNTGD